MNMQVKLSEQIRVVAGEAQASSAAVSGQALARKASAIALTLVVPVCLLLFWELMVRWTGTRLIPPPADVAVMMWDFLFGGIYDDAFSASFPIHLWMSLQRVY